MVKYSAWVVGVPEAEAEPGLVLFKGVLDKKAANTYTYHVDVESTSSDDHPSVITKGTLVIRSAVPMNWRMGQNLTINISQFDVKEDEQK